jgi:hypothetical protein
MPRLHPSFFAKQISTPRFDHVTRQATVLERCDDLLAILMRRDGPCARPGRLLDLHMGDAVTGRWPVDPDSREGARRDSGPLFSSGGSSPSVPRHPISLERSASQESSEDYYQKCHRILPDDWSASVATV